LHCTSGLIAAFALLQGVGAYAAPPIILEEVRLVPQDGAPQGGFGHASDLSGNVAVVTAIRPRAFPDETIPDEEGEVYPRGAAYVYERNASGAWQQIAKLLPIQSTFSGDNFGTDVAIEGNTIIASGFRAGSYAFERTASGWLRGPKLYSGYYVDLAGDRMMISLDGNGAKMYARSSTGWTLVDEVNEGFAMNDDDYKGPRVALSGSRAAHGSFGAEGLRPAEVYIYRQNADGTWPERSEASVTRPNAGLEEGDFSSTLDLSGDTLVAGGKGAYIFERDAQGAWNIVKEIADGRGLAVEGNTVLARTHEGFVRLYRRNASGVWSHAATLASSSDERLGEPNMDANRVIAGASIFNIPPTLPPARTLHQEDFEDNVANNWRSEEAAQFTIASVGGTRVYRQSDTSDDARAIYTGVTWSDQSIQADIVPRGFAAGASRWFGLVVRYSDARNYYYVTVRNSNVVELKRMFNGVYQTLSSAALPVVVNRAYNVRLEAVGTLLRVLIDGQPIVSARDDLLASGRAGLAMFRTQADFDNILVSPNPRIRFFEPFDRRTLAFGWTLFGPRTPGGSFDQLWYQDFATDTYQQASVAGDALAVNGEPTDDQIIQTRVRAKSYSGAGRWVGVIGRFVDRDNYYYVTLRSDNTVSLRKLTNGAISVLDTASQPVTLGTWYRIRFDLVGTKLRVFVDDRLLLEATDATHRAGRYGLATYKATAEADDFSASLP
jgi:hypothetical protein